MLRSGSLVICVQNLDYSGANQVLFNIIDGRLHKSNVIILSPTMGTFAARFFELGASVRIGDINTLVQNIRDIFCIICNTIMTANIVEQMASKIPVIWIIHEWWTESEIVENLRIRNNKHLTLETIRIAFKKATCCVFVCESQKNLYNPVTRSEVIYIGVSPPPPLITKCGTVPKGDYASTIGPILIPTNGFDEFEKEPFIFLSLGIICPRKNQHWCVEIFKKLVGNRKDVKLLIVGARYTRTYEIEYVEKLKEIIGDDKRIEIHDVTDNVDKYFQVADCLLFTSKNEVTPMVIPEAMSYGIPVLSTNIGGITEMFTDGVEGFMFDVGDDVKAIECAKLMLDNESKRRLMGRAGIAKYHQKFRMSLMVNNYRNLILKVAPPVVLLDLDGTLIDWDKHFIDCWGHRSKISRSNSYHMEDCVPPAYRQQAIDVMLSPGFFESLPLMKGARQAIEEMEQYGFNLKICTAPLYESDFCCQEKVKWVQQNLGERWLKKLVMCSDKTLIKADYLIDDKQYVEKCNGEQVMSCWKQIIYDQPYNRESSNLPRLYRWKDWSKVLLPQMMIHSEMNPYAISPCQSPPRVQIPSAVEQQRRQDFVIGVNNEPLTPDELSTLAGTLSFISSGDTPTSSPKHQNIFPSKDRKKLEGRKKVIDPEFDRKSVFDNNNGEESKIFEAKTL